MVSDCYIFNTKFVQDNERNGQKCWITEVTHEEDYNHLIMANVSDYVDFEDWFGNKNAKILCIMLA